MAWMVCFVSDGGLYSVVWGECCGGWLWWLVVVELVCLVIVGWIRFVTSVVGFKMCRLCACCFNLVL